MGRFANTVRCNAGIGGLLIRLNSFATVAQRLRLGNEHALIDLGIDAGFWRSACKLAHRRRDPEPAMLVAQERRAARCDSKAILMAA